MSIFKTRNRDRGRPGHPTQFATVEKRETDMELPSEDIGAHSINDVPPLMWTDVEQIQAAADTETEPGRLVVLSFSAHTDARINVALNPSTPAETLNDMTHDPNPDVRRTVASSDKLTPESVESFCTDEEFKFVVRTALRNPNISASVRARFVGHDNWMLREGVAWNTSTTDEEFELLAKDEDPAVVFGVVRNPSTPRHVLKLIESRADVDDSFLRERLSHHPNYAPHTNQL